jgi:hypothetical protein
MSEKNSDNEALAQAIRRGNFLTHCPTCREIVASVGFSNCRGFFENDPWAGYKEYGCQRCYCPNCDHFLDGWFRSKLPDYSDAEVDITVWTENKATGRWEPMGPLFGNIRSKNAENGVNEVANEHRWLFKEARFWRSLSGPRFVKDEKRFSVSIPLAQRTRETAEKLISKIETKLRVKRAGELNRVEVIDDTLWGHFDDKMIGTSYVLAMWKVGQLPAEVTVWSYNEGRRYQNKAWDSKTEAAAVHPSHA